MTHSVVASTANPVRWSVVRRGGYSPITWRTMFSRTTIAIVDQVRSRATDPSITFNVNPNALIANDAITETGASVPYDR
jgi:hypothetical protein